MKACIYLFSLNCLIIPFFNASQPAAAPTNQSINIPPITVNVFSSASAAPSVLQNVDANTHANANASANTHTVTNTQITNTTIISLWMAALQQASAQVMHGGTQVLASLGGYCLQYKYRLSAGVCASLYAMLWWYLYRMNRYLQDTHNWSYWPQNYSFEALLTHDADELTGQLLIAIQERYLNTQEPTNIIYPLVQFMQEIAREELILRNYLKYTAWLKKSYLYKLPFLPNLHSEKAEQLLHRLLFIHNLFKKWAAQQNCIRLETPITRWRPHQRLKY